MNSELELMCSIFYVQIYLQ